jgi:hypothetical protein
MARHYTTTDPGAWNNELPTTPSGNNMRGKSDIRQPAGGIEFVNTKNEEMVTYYYTNGAFLRFEKFAADLFIPVDYQSHIFGNSFETVNKNKVIHVDGTIDMVELGDKFTKTGDVDRTQKHGEQWLKDMKELHNMKRRFEIKRCKLHNHIDQAEGQVKSGTLASCPTEQISIKSIYTVKAMIWTPAVKSACSHTVAALEDNSTIYEVRSGGSGIAISGGWKCLTCWGDGMSPSSQDGEWEPDEIKKLITSKIIELTDPLSESERHFGTSKHPEGGTEIRSSNKNVVEHIGNVFNTMESYRKDPKGKLVPYGIKVDPHGSAVYPQFRESGLIERVHVDPVPGGSYHKNVADKYTLTVGANGISMKTNGDFHMFGIQTNILSERTVINGNTEVVISGERVDLSGDIITLRPRKVERTIEDASGANKPLPSNAKAITEPEQQVLIDGNLNVAMNVIIAGGAHIEGELTVHHITAPCEYHITETDFEVEIQPQCGDPIGEEIPCVEDVIKGPTHADILPGCLIGYAIVGSGSSAGSWPVYSVCAPNSVKVHPHHHWFKNMPMKLIRDDTDMEVTVGELTETKTLDPHSVVRAVGARNNFAVKSLPMPVHNSKTNNTVIEKFEECG